MEDYLEGYEEEIVEYDDEEDELGDEIDDILDALSGEEDEDDLGYDDDYDDLGEEDEFDEIGARRRYRGRRRRRLPRRRRRRGRRLPKAWLRPVRPRQFRKYPLGLGVTNVAAGATAVINVNPQLPFKLLRLSTPAADFTIDNIQIGTVSQFVAAGACPSEGFAPNAVGVGLKGDTAVPGVAIQLTVTNTAAAAANFTGMLLGLVAQ